jgi:hypothetical protein
MHAESDTNQFTVGYNTHLCVYVYNLHKPTPKCAVPALWRGRASMRFTMVRNASVERRPSLGPMIYSRVAAHKAAHKHGHQHRWYVAYYVTCQIRSTTIALRHNAAPRATHTPTPTLNPTKAPMPTATPTPTPNPRTFHPPHFLFTSVSRGSRRGLSAYNRLLMHTYMCSMVSLAACTLASVNHTAVCPCNSIHGSTQIPRTIGRKRAWVLRLAPTQ